MSEPLSWTRDLRDGLTPEQVLELLRDGNRRYREGNRRDHDYEAEQRATREGQWPAAAILGCIDSRVPVEILFDVGIGHVFTARVAGNIVNTDLLGSLEFACGVAGAKLVCVLGHTDCGAIKGAISGVGVGNLRALLERVEPALQSVDIDRLEASRPEHVDAVARANVLASVELIRAGSEPLRGLESEGTIRIVGALYDVASGEVEFL